MSQNRYSPAALWGFLLPFLVVLAVMVCSATVPTRVLDQGWGSAIGLSGFGFLTFSFLMCGRAVRTIKESQGQVKGYLLARMGQILPAVILIWMVVAYFQQGRT